MRLCLVFLFAVILLYMCLPVSAWRRVVIILFLSKIILAYFLDLMLFWKGFIIHNMHKYTLILVKTLFVSNISFTFPSFPKCSLTTWRILTYSKLPQTNGQTNKQKESINTFKLSWKFLKMNVKRQILTLSICFLDKTNITLER